MQVSDSIEIAALAQLIWSQVADPTQTPRWSPENTGATVAAVSGPPRPLRVGEVFDGTNRRGRAKWVTQCVVTASEPGREFAFEVRKIGLRRPRLGGRIATWSYAFESIEGGTRVTETWADGRTRWPDWLAAVFDRIATGGSLFADFQRINIHRTLTRMRAELEGPASEG